MRYENWPEILADMIEEFNSKEFNYGSLDCALMAGINVNRLTGKDYYTKFLNNYSTSKGAYKALVKDGVKTVIDIADKFLARHKYILQTGRGDIVCYNIPELGPALGICLGSVCAFKAPIGLTYVKLKDCSISWRVE